MYFQAPNQVPDVIQQLQHLQTLLLDQTDKNLAQNKESDQVNSLCIYRLLMKHIWQWCNQSLQCHPARFYDASPPPQHSSVFGKIPRDFLQSLGLVSPFLIYNCLISIIVVTYQYSRLNSAQVEYPQQFITNKICFHVFPDYQSFPDVYGNHSTK